MKISEVALTEYNPYYKPYIDRVGDTNLLAALQEGLQTTKQFFSGIPDHKLEYRYADGKWTPKEILLHLIDTERVFCYRAMTFARSEGAVLIGFDENEFTNNSMANTRTIQNILEEYDAVRKATIALFSSFTKPSLLKTGEANNSVMSVRASGFVICGHEKHHKEVIQKRYLN
ncbi:MAG: DinB family protein [Altibacter sp.]|uniref:DinB family protein n=1 Tax=Altibacter sp. TaxID=2024823 RepID=UPI001D7E9338|nr:DinB family protein [Altibacter sp.]MBZ0326231.1 DinB family protein [Altibacter sp.]